MIHPTKYRRPLTDAQENQIRRRFFKLQHDPAAIIRDYNMSEKMLRRVVCGPITRQGSYAGVERAYG